MNIESCFKIGYILKTHGLKGELTISLDEPAPENISSLRSIFIEKDGRLVPYVVNAISYSGAKAYLKLEDVDSIDDAEQLVKQSLYLEKTTRPKSARNEFYDDEIISFEVVDKTSGALGKVVEIMQAGPNRLLVLDREGKEVLIPVNSPFITSINKTKKLISVDLPDGFLDI